MSSYSATLEINKLEYTVVLCEYGFTQAIGPHGRVNERVRHGLLKLVLNVPEGAAGDLLMLWAATPYYPLDGHIFFHPSNTLISGETVSFKDGECVSYKETFEVGSEVLGSYRCSLTIAALKLELTTGAPLSSSPSAIGSATSLASTAVSAKQAYTTAHQAKTAAKPAIKPVSSLPRAAVLGAVAGQASSSPAQPLIKQDNSPYSKKGKDQKRAKSFIDDAGNLSPANPKGKATIQQHVRGSEPRNSPYTSIAAQRNVGKVYGDQEISVDQPALAQDIASGQVTGVEIISHAQVIEHLQGAQTEAQARYNRSTTLKSQAINQERLDRANQDITNAKRDKETLVKGTVPAKYVTATKKSS